MLKLSFCDNDKSSRVSMMGRKNTEKFCNFSMDFTFQRKTIVDAVKDFDNSDSLVVRPRFGTVCDARGWLLQGEVFVEIQRREMVVHGGHPRKRL